MAVLARLWLHYCAASGWFRAERTGLSTKTTGAGAPVANFKLRSHENKAQSGVPAETAAPQFRPTDASQTCSSGQLMVLMNLPTKEIHVQFSIFAIDSGQLMVPRAANGWSL
jgi:hypothetical protein